MKNETMKSKLAIYSLGIALTVINAVQAQSVSSSPAESTVLPPPEPPFKGVIGETYKDSKPDKIPIIKAPEGAPNVLLVLIDDCGFGQWGTFGGAIPTPNLDRLAKNGLRYTRFHTTALCSPTRAALLTGRNHHSVGMGVITELADAYPGYSGQIPKSAAMVSEVLRQNGYSTEYVGKNHQIADWETSISGPYDRWATRNMMWRWLSNEACWIHARCRNDDNSVRKIQKSDETSA